MELFYLMIIIRFAIMLGLIFWFFKFLKFDIFAFSITFFLSYFIILIFEIIYIHRRYSKNLQQK